MNNFLNLQASLDYLTTNRPYFTQTWEFIAAASDYLIPWQVLVTDSRKDITITTVDSLGAEVDITNHFYGPSLITGWTKTGSGTWSSSGNSIVAGTVDGNDFQTSNTFTLAAGDTIFIEPDIAAYTAATDYSILLRKGGVTIESFVIGVEERKWYTVAASGADYTIRILYSGAGGSVTTNTPLIADSLIVTSGNYRWYDGSQLYDTLSGVFILKVESDASTWYSDPIDPCGFDGKLKFKVSSDEDFGGIKYDAGYEQWIYKDISVNRAPRADIEITGDSLNGEIVKEKTVSAVRFVLRMRVTELEYEAFVHSIGGDIEVTDRYGRVYDAQSVEITDPTWYRSNGVLEISFVDGNNVNVWSKNNSSL